MPESELFNRFKYDIQCMTSNSGNDNTNIKVIENIEVINQFVYLHLRVLIDPYIFSS